MMSWEAAAWLLLGGSTVLMFAGLPVGFAVMIIVSYLTPAPSREMQAFIDEVRKPRGKTILEEKTV